MNGLTPAMRRLLVGGALAVGTGLIVLSGLSLMRTSSDGFLDESYGDRPAPTESPSPPATTTAAAPSATPESASPEIATSPPAVEEARPSPDVDQLISDYRGAILRNREAIAPRLNLGAALMQKGRIQEALAEYEQARRLNDTVPDLHYHLGNAYSQMGRAADAIAAYRRAITLKSDYAKAHYNLGNSFLSLGQKAEAEQAYRDAIASDGQFAEAYGNLGLLLVQRQAYDAARKPLTQAQNLLKAQGKTAQLKQVETTLQQLPPP